MGLKGKAHTEYKRRLNERSQEYAKKTWSRWKPREIAYLLESDEKLEDIAKKLGRTYKGCDEKRKKIRRELRRREQDNG
jgi:heterodisulfide reductase subunit B